MSLITQIRADWTNARKAREADKATFLGTIVGEIESKGKRAEGGPLTDAEVLAHLKKTLNSVIETAGHLANATGRETEVAKNAAERVILEAYIPQQMTEEEIEAYAKLKAAEGLNLGQIMSALKADHPGLYDGKSASAVVKGVLAEVK
jgi:uncharacterized protein YqeY